MGDFLSMGSYFVNDITNARWAQYGFEERRKQKDSTPRGAVSDLLKYNHTLCVWKKRSDGDDVEIKDLLW